MSLKWRWGVVGAIFKSVVYFWGEGLTNVTVLDENWW